MDFTREPIIETVITPREGYRLVVRSSKNTYQEEHFVEALEVISFGSALFFRCVERPKPFIVPASDYEVLEVRETRMVLKTPIQEKSAQPEKVVQERAPRESSKQKVEVEKKESVEATSPDVAPAVAEAPRGDRRRDRRRSFRKRRGQARDEAGAGQTEEKMASSADSEGGKEEVSDEKLLTTTPLLSAILPPPTTLIRDDLPRLKDAYKGALFFREEKETSEEDDDALLAQLRGSEFLDRDEQASGDPEVSQEPFQAPFQESFRESLEEGSPNSLSFEQESKVENSLFLPHDSAQDKKDMEPLSP